MAGRAARPLLRDVCRCLGAVRRPACRSSRRPGRGCVPGILPVGQSAGPAEHDRHRVPVPAVSAEVRAALRQFRRIRQPEPLPDRRQLSRAARLAVGRPLLDIRRRRFPHPFLARGVPVQQYLHARNRGSRGEGAGDSRRHPVHILRRRGNPDRGTAGCLPDYGAANRDGRFGRAQGRAAPTGGRARHPVFGQPAIHRRSSLSLSRRANRGIGAHREPCRRCTRRPSG